MAQWSVSRQGPLARGTRNDIHEVVMIADEDGNIINTFGAASNVIIAAGLLDGYAGVHKFGAVFGTATADLSTLWTAADTSATSKYDWTYTNGPVTVVSDNAADTTDITVQGLDSDYNFAEEIFTLTGATPTAEGSVNFTRVNRAFMNEETNVGKIQVKRDTTVVTEIGAGYGQTLQSFYTVPAGKTAYVMNITASASKNQVVDVFLFRRQYGEAWRVNTTMSLNQSNQTLEFPVPLKLNEKTDIEVCIRGSGNATVSCDFTLILVDNEG